MHARIGKKYEHTILLKHVPFFLLQEEKLYENLLRRHRFEPNFIVHCSRPGCGASLKTVAGLRTHHYRKHVNDHDVEDDLDTSDPDENCPTDRY